MPNHPNRSRNSPARNPAPEEIRSAREQAGLSQPAAARLIYSTRRTWQGWESGNARMHPALWELFRIALGLIPPSAPVERYAELKRRGIAILPR